MSYCIYFIFNKLIQYYLCQNKNQIIVHEKIMNLKSERNENVTQITHEVICMNFAMLICKFSEMYF